MRLSRSRSGGAVAILATCLLLSGPRPGRAEDFISYKYADYRESGGRIAVQTQGVLIEQDLGTEMQVKLQGVIDAIAGATPTGQPAPAGSDQVPLFEIADRRKAWNADFSRQFPRLNLDVGFANSRESDYTSNGWSLNTVTDFNQKNTTLLAGLAGTDDDIKTTYQTAWKKKRTYDLIAGLTQLLDPRTAVSLNFTWGRVRGYQSDPYKTVQKTIEVDPGDFVPLQFLENRPEQRNKFTAYTSLNHSFAGLNAALDASVRFYHDTFGTNARTLEVAWLQRLGRDFILQPELRLYDQGAADFYHYQLDQSPVQPVPGLPPTQGPFYSSDYRLSAFRSTTYGMKATWTVSARLQLDVEIQQYHMRGTDGVTAQSAYPSARIVTAGARLTW
jgi:hypothetical protein